MPEECRPLTAVGTLNVRCGRGTEMFAWPGV